MQIHSLIRSLIVFLTLLLSNVSIAQTLNWSRKGNPLNLQVNGVAFRADGQKVLSGTNCHPARIRIFDVGSANLDWDYNVGMTYMCIMGVTFSANSNYIAAIEEFGNIFLFDNTGATPIIIDTINTGTAYAFATAIAPTNDKIAIGCSDGKLKIYHIPGDSFSLDISAHAGWVTTVCFSPDGTKIITGGSDDRVRIWSSNGNLLFTCQGHIRDVTNVKVTPDNNFVVSSSQDNRIRVWNMATGAAVRTIIGHSGDVNGIDISPDGSKIVSASSDSTCKIWNLNTGALIATFGVVDSGSVLSVAWSPNGDKILTGNALSDVTLWNIPLTLGLGESFHHPYINIFPNPAFNTATIQWPADVKPEQILIYNQLGQLRKRFTGCINGTLQLDLSDCSEGHYWVIIQSSVNQFVGKLTIMR